MASNFVRVGDSEYVINIERVAYVTDNREKTGDVYIHFASYDPDINDLACVLLMGDDADRFMAMLDRQTGAW